MIRFIKSSQGFGLIGILVVIAVIALAGGGGFYWNETKKQQSFLETGADAVKRAEELKKQIESRQEQIYRSPTSIDSSVDTADWKTYRNEKYGFEVKYPIALFLQIFDNGIILYHEKPVVATEYVSLGFTVKLNPQKLTKEEYFDGDPGPNLYGSTEKKDIVNITIGGRSAVKFDPYITLAGGEEIVIPIESGFITVFDNGGAFRSDGSLTDILSTFKFIEPVDASNQKTYRNEKYGFEIKYPEQWKLNESEGKISFVFQTAQVDIEVNPRPVGLEDEDREYIEESKVEINGLNVRKSILRSKKDQVYWIEEVIVGTKNNYFIFTDFADSLGQLRSSYDSVLSSFKELK